MNFSVLDGYFDLSSSEDTDTSNQGYKPPITKPLESQLISQLTANENKDIGILRSESDKVRKQLRHLYKLRKSKYKTVTNEISKSYQRMHLRAAQLTKQFGQTQLAIINWRILFEQKYLSEIKSLITHFNSFNSNNNDEKKEEKEEESDNKKEEDDNINNINNINIPHLSEEAPSSGDNDPSILLPIDPSILSNNEKIKENTETIESSNIKLDELNNLSKSKTKSKRIRVKSINNSDSSLRQKMDAVNRPKSRYSMEKPFKRYKNNRLLSDINGYLINYRRKLEVDMGGSKKELKDLCKNLRLELRNEKYLQQKQELLVSYDERIAIVLLLFHWFIETNKYELKSNIYSQNNICNQLSAQQIKHYYLCIGIVTQIQNKFDCLVLDARNEIGNNIRKWFKILSRKDIRHLKPSILLKHINCFIRDFIKSYHYIITDIVKNQNNKYNIEYVIKKHDSINTIQFKQYIQKKHFLCKKNQTTQYYYKQQLTAVSLRWTLLRLLQRCIYSRLSIIGILPGIHSLGNNPLLINKTKQQLIIKKHILPKKHIYQNDGDYDNLFQSDNDKKLSIHKQIKKYKRKKKPMAMQMVTLDANGKSSNENIETLETLETLETSISSERKEDLIFNSKMCDANTNNIEYITFQHEEEEKKETKVIQYGHNKETQIPTFSIYGLPRNSDYEFQLLDQHFFNQCGWMRNLSPGQLGIEEIYWCNTPPLNLHANSDILLNVKDMNSKSSRRNTDNISDINDETAASLSELYVSNNHYNKPSLKIPKSDKSGTVTLTKGIAKHIKDVEEKKEEKVMDECQYDYTIRPFGDALALIECLDELTAPHDMNECLGYVVDVIFRTAQTYRKFNIRKQMKMERYHLDLSLLSDYKDNNKDKNKKKGGIKHKLLRTNEDLQNNNDSLSHINGEAAIGADVFFPLFIWVIVHSKIRNIHRSVFIMSHYNDSDAMKTKVGYNVSTLHSALDHIMKANRKLYVRQNFRR